MGLFDSFKKKAEEENKGAPSSGSSSDEKQTASPKKKSELLKVLNESVWESAHEDFKSNKQFITKDESGTKYIALLFDTNSIQGLAGKAARKDESKGSIIEAIRTGRIKTYIRTEMLMDDCFIIIPDKETIENMDEFRLLVNTEYILCMVTPDGMIETITENGDPDGKEHTVSFHDVQNLIKSEGDVKELFPKHKEKASLFSNADSDGNSSDVEDIEDLPEENVISESPEEFDAINANVSETQAPVTGDVPPPPSAPVPSPAQQSQPALQQAAPVQHSNQAGDQFDFGVSGNDNVDEVLDSDDYYEDSYDEITEDAVREFVTRKFYSDDLGLEVSTQPFDVQFMHGNPYLPFDENRGPGWLNTHLSNIAKDGNVRMQRLHTENLYRLRERYMRLVQAHCESIAKSLDITTEDNQYGRLRQAIETNKDENEKLLKESIKPKLDQLERNWQATLKRVGESAAADAIRSHEDRYGSQHKADMMNLEAHERDEIERDYQNALKRLNDDRRAEATKLLDIAINTTLKELSEIYLRVLQEEKKEYIRIQNEITKFTDENRKSEIARIEALSEENKQNNKAEEVRKEYASKIKAMAAEFESKTASLQADVRKMRIDHDNELRFRTSEWDKKLEEEKQKTTELQAKFDELLGKYSSLEDKKNQEYAERIDRLKDENNSYKDELDHMAAVHKRSNKIAIYLVIVAVIAAIGAGFMLGSVLNVRRASQAEQDALNKVQHDTSSATTSSGVPSDDAANSLVEGSQ